MTKFRTKGYATEANAVRVLDRNLHLIDGYSHFVAVQDGRYFPVVIFTDRPGRSPLNVVALASRGIAIVN